MSRIKLSENPEYASFGVRTLSRTAATKAIIDAVNMEKASSKTPMIAVIKMANKCQASGVMSQGTGRCQITTPSITVSILFVQSSFWLFPVIVSNEVEISWYRETRLPDGQVPNYKFQNPIPI